LRWEVRVTVFLDSSFGLSSGFSLASFAGPYKRFLSVSISFTHMFEPARAEWADFLTSSLSLKKVNFVTIGLGYWCLLLYFPSLWTLSKGISLSIFMFSWISSLMILSQSSPFSLKEVLYGIPGKIMFSVIDRHCVSMLLSSVWFCVISDSSCCYSSLATLLSISFLRMSKLLLPLVMSSQISL